MGAAPHLGQLVPHLREVLPIPHAPDGEIDCEVRADRFEWLKTGALPFTGEHIERELSLPRASP